MREKWRGANRFTLLPEGKNFIPKMLSAIDEAREFVLLEQYFVKSGQLTGLFIEALVDAAKRGVSVLVLFDSYGAQGLRTEDRREMEHAGIALRYYNPVALGRLNRNFSRDHRKLLVADYKIAFTGGFCLVDEAIDSWSEVAVQVEGPVVGDWVQLFSRLWNSPATRGTSDASMLPAVKAFSHMQEFTPGMRGRVIWGQGYRYQAIRKSLQQRIVNSRQRLWFCTPYFAPTRGLRRRLAHAARRGVDVRILVPGAENNDHPGVQRAGELFYSRLLEAGVRIFEFQPSFIHAKFALADNWCTIGSCNFDHWSLQWNLEANQEVDNREFAAEVAALFERNFQVSREIDPKRWAKRPLGRRILSWFYGRISLWLNRLR